MDYDAAIGRWHVVDPMSEKYYEWTSYVYCGNNSVNMIDPIGTDWYRSENGDIKWRKSKDKEYTDDNGNVWINIGSNMLFTNGERSILFQQFEGDDGELTLHTAVINQNEEKQKEDLEAAYAQLSTSSSRVAAKEYHKNPTLKNWLKFCSLEVVGQYTDPVRVVNGLAIGIGGISASSSSKPTFGRSPNAKYHTYRHIEKMGLSREAVNNVILSDFKKITSSIKEGQPVNRIISVNGKELQYTVYKLKDGTFNVGRIHGKK